MLVEGWGAPAPAEKGRPVGAWDSLWSAEGALHTGTAAAGTVLVGKYQWVSFQVQKKA